MRPREQARALLPQVWLPHHAGGTAHVRRLPLHQRADPPLPRRPPPPAERQGAGLVLRPARRHLGAVWAGAGAGQLCFHVPVGAQHTDAKGRRRRHHLLRGPGVWHRALLPQRRAEGAHRRRRRAARLVRRRQGKPGGRAAAGQLHCRGRGALHAAAAGHAAQRGEAHPRGHPLLCGPHVGANPVPSGGLRRAPAAAAPHRAHPLALAGRQLRRRVGAKPGRIHAHRQDQRADHEHHGPAQGVGLHPHGHARVRHARHAAAVGRLRGRAHRHRVVPARQVLRVRGGAPWRRARRRRRRRRAAADRAARHQAAQVGAHAKPAHPRPALADVRRRGRALVQLLQTRQPLPRAARAWRFAPAAAGPE